MYSSIPLPDLPDSAIPTIQAETSVLARLRRKDGALYVRVSFLELERVSPHLRSKAELLLWLHLKALQTIRGSTAWLRPNTRILAAWGIAERTRQRAIAGLERAGLIEIATAEGRKTQVRLLTPSTGER